jgi:hypothetical protein
MKDKEPNHNEAERIDKEITRACEHGSNECKKRPMHYWSIDLHVLKQELSVMCQYKYRRKKGLLLTALITRATKMEIYINKDMRNKRNRDENQRNKRRCQQNTQRSSKEAAKKQQREETKCYWN